MGVEVLGGYGGPGIDLESLQWVWRALGMCGEPGMDVEGLKVVWRVLVG